MAAISATAVVEDLHSAPADYDAFYRQYHMYVVHLVSKNGIAWQDAHDVAHKIIIYFIERDFLKVFDPTKVFSYKGQLRPARFKSFLNVFVQRYLLGIRDSYAKHYGREMLIMDAPTDQDGAEKGTWKDIHAPSFEANYGAIDEALAASETVCAMRAHLVQVERRARLLEASRRVARQKLRPFRPSTKPKSRVLRKRCDLPTLFDAVLCTITAHDEISGVRLAAEFGVSPAAMYSWLKAMRGHLAHFGPAAGIVGPER